MRDIEKSLAGSLEEVELIRSGKLPKKPASEMIDRVRKELKNDMRLIRFRGKSKLSIEELVSMSVEHHNGWVYGNLIQNGDNPYIVGDIVDSSDEYIAHEYWIPVHPESLGQFTGLLDKDGKDIYVGSIVQYGEPDSHSPNRDSGGGIIDFNRNEGFHQTGIIGFHAPSFAVQGVRNVRGDEIMLHVPIDWIDGGVEVIGNVYDNPELLIDL